MADYLDRDQKTEAPTPRRREQAREKGQVSVSADLTVGVALLSASLLLGQQGSLLGEPLVGLMRETVNDLPRELSADGLGETTAGAMLAIAQSVGIFCLVLGGVGLGVNLMQTGFNLSTDPLRPDWGKLSWIKGWQRLFSRRSAAKGGFAILKLLALAAITVSLGSSTWHGLVAGPSLGTRVLAGWAWATQLSTWLSCGLIALGILDLLFQRSQHETDLMMSRQELREEVKEQEGDPQTRARIRKLRRERARKQIQSAVPKAHVIVTNPTHFAVAIRYDRASMSAPLVVAKGKDFLAKTIIDIARRHQIPIVERKEVARMLYATVEVGSEVPQSLYRAVAEILAYLHRIQPRW